MTATFNLLSEPWLPVRGPNGVGDISLREALTQAQNYTRIDASSPLMSVAALRLCLAVLHRALKGPADAKQAAQWYTGGFPAGVVEKYLDDHHNRFDLFHPERPFLQLPGLTPEMDGGKSPSHWTRLGAEVGSANTSALFNPTKRLKILNRERDDAAIPSEIALRLLEAQMFSLQGTIHQFAYSASASPIANAALFVAEGENLHRTFCLNLVPYSNVMRQSDQPAWERDPHTVAELRERNDKATLRPQAIRGRADRYVWLSRSILLHPEDAGGAVRLVGFGAGIPIDGSPVGEGDNLDPMVALVSRGNQKKQWSATQVMQRELLFWRDLSAILPEPQDESYLNFKNEWGIRLGTPPGTLGHARSVLFEIQQTGSGQPVVPISVYGQLTEDAKTFSFRREVYTFPKFYIKDTQTFTDTIWLALNDAKKLGSSLHHAVRKLCEELLTKVGDRKPHKDDVSALAGTLQVEATYWARLEAPFRTYLLALDGDAEAAQTEWQAELRRASWSAWEVAVEGVGTSGPALRAEQKAVGLLLAALRPLEDSA